MVPDAKPRLLILITLAEAGGAQTSVSHLLPGLSSEFDVTLAAHGPGPLRGAARAAGVRFVPLEHLRRDPHPWHDVLALFELVKLCRRLQPDIVHAHSSKAGALGRLAAALAGVPIRIFTVHGWSFAAYGGPSGRLYLWVERLLRRFTTVVVCVAGSAREVGAAVGACRRDQTVVIHNAVDVSSFAPSQREGRPLIMSVGRFAFPKDYGTLVGALAATRAPYRAAFVGDGPMLNEVAADVRRRGLADRVMLLGARRDVPDLLASGDVFVLASRSEGFPIAILEAMAVGLPVVATDVGGISEAVVHGETGLLVSPADPAALADALDSLLRDPILRRRMGARGRERARRHFDLPRFRRAYLELYRRELERQGLADSASQLDPANRVRLVRGAPSRRSSGAGNAETGAREAEERRLTDHEQDEQEPGREQQRGAARAVGRL